MSDEGLFTRHWTLAQPTVSAYVASLFPDFHEAEDLLQNVALVLLRKFPEYDPRRPFVPWALGIAKLEVLTRRRSHARSPLAYRPELADAVAAAFEREGPELAARVRALRECVREVRGRSSEAVRLRYEEGLPPRDVASRLGMSGGAVRVLLARIRAGLETCIGRRLSEARR